MKSKDNFVEEWSKEFDKCEKEQLTKEDAMLLMNIIFKEKELNKDKELLDMLEVKTNDTFCTVIWRRFKNFPMLRVSPSVALFLGEVAKNFGICTIMVAIVIAKAAQYRTKNIDIHFICNRIIPMGFPTEREFKKLWELQKIDLEERQAQEFNSFMSDNLLDYNSSYKSVIDVLNSIGKKQK